MRTDTSIDQKIKAAIDLHQDGNLVQAATIYRSVLQADPINADIIHLLGVISYQTGNPQKAIDLIDRAINLNPNVANFHSNKGNALKALKKL